MNYDEYESEFYDHSLDPYNTYEEYLDSHITKEDLMYLGDIELARQLKEEVPLSHPGIPLQNLDTHQGSVHRQEKGHRVSQTQLDQRQNQVISLHHP